MKYRYIVNTNTIVRNIMKEYIQNGHKVLDCTVGNGNDTIFLAQLVGEGGKVYGFDIQDIALERTREKLIELNIYNRVDLIKDSHENINKYINGKLNFIIYNLGYLPKGDKSIKTNKTSTVNSLKQALELIDMNGLILLTVYTGHVGGVSEKNAVEDLLTSLNQKEFNVLKYDFINQINNPPMLYAIEKSN